ncbi:hypothetical protein [Bordetella sp. FB-8]|uniref:hypothetical protein n=1 Tax=Bordetella sp. FB-8 TaxID=1159870 RepID=UPI00039A783A|nr:hypothetical protein [Bordetella sp. FB-8]
MQLLTLEQLRATQEAGAVLSVTLHGAGAAFEIQIETRRGLAKLVKARAARSAPQVRRFTNVNNALLLLRELGIREARIDGQQWRPEERDQARPARPDRAAHLKAAHGALAYTDWLEQKVAKSRAGLADGSNVCIEADEWDLIRKAKQAARAGV